MERRHFLGLALGLAVTTALAARAAAAPLSPQPLAGGDQLPGASESHSAVTSTEEVERLKPEAVHWGRRWHRRHWGWRRRHWRHHHWRHHHWHRHHWRRHW